MVIDILKFIWYNIYIVRKKKIKNKTKGTGDVYDEN